MAHGYRPVISKIRCVNPNSKGVKVKNYNFLKYIATREGVDLTRIRNITANEAAEENMDLNDAGEDILFQGAQNETYLKYMAYRPKSHGLFGNIDTEDFKLVTKKLNQVSTEKKNVYRGVISLSSTDAEALGYKNIEKWNLYLKSVMPDIAHTLRLSPNDITWVAAFHMEDAHPHVHYMLWDNRDKVQSPYIHVRQQEECREICQKAMFSDEDETLIKEITAAERKEYYELQNASRKEITDYFKNIFSEKAYVPGIITENLPGRISKEEHQQLNKLYEKILRTMPGTGRVAYKFMPLECKAYLNQVTEILLKRTDINREYQQYINAVEKIQGALGKTQKEIDKVRDNAITELYGRTGNIVLKSVCMIKDEILNENGQRYKQKEGFLFGQKEYTEPIPVAEMEVHNEEYSFTNSEEYFEFEPREEPAADIKFLDEAEAQNGVIPEKNRKKFDIEEIKKFKNEVKDMLTIGSENYNPVLAEEIMLEKLQDENIREGDRNWIYINLGEMYADNECTMHNYDKAIEYFEKVIRSRDDYHDFRAFTFLGKIYSDKYYENIDEEKAEAFYKKAIEINPERAGFIKLRLSRLYMKEQSQLYNVDAALGVLKTLGENADYAGSVSLQIGNIYSALGDKKEALHFYGEAEKKGNAFAALQAGRICMESNNENYNLSNSIAHLENAIRLNEIQQNNPKFKGEKTELVEANILLAKAYMKKEDTHNLQLAEEHLLKALSSVEQKESQEFRKLSSSDKAYKDTAFLYLGKLYANSDFEKRDIAKAMEYLETCAGADKEAWYAREAELQIAKIHMNKDNEAFYDLNKAAGCLEEIISEIEEREASGQEISSSDEMYRNSSCLYLGKLYANSDFEKRDIAKAMEYLETCAGADKEAWYAKEAELQIAKIHMNKNNEAFYDLGKAVGCLEEIISGIEAKKASGLEMSATDEMYRNSTSLYLGKLYANSDFGKRDIAKAMEYLETCAGADEEVWYAKEAELQIAKIHMDEENVEFYNLEKAAVHLERILSVVDEKEKSGQEISPSDEYYRIAAYFNKGKIYDVYEDLRAISCYERCIDNESVYSDSAYICLAKIYMRKESPVLDYYKACDYLSKVKNDDKGIVSVLFGNIHADEQSPYYNMEKAFRFYMQATEKENTSAMVKVAKCYLFGMGVEKDKEMAKFWLNEAIVRGDKYAKEYLEKINQQTFNQYSYALLRQIFASMGQTKNKKIQQLQEQEFKTKSKQVQREEQLHHN